MRNSTLKILALLLLATLPLALAAASDEPKLLLPKGGKAKWVLHQDSALPDGSRFEVDADGKAWLLTGPRVLFGSNGAVLVLDEPVRDIAFGGSRLVASTDLAAGTLVTRKVKGRLAAKVKRQMLLPEPSWRLASGPQSAAVIGFDAGTGKGQLYRVDDQRKILEWPARILAATGADGAWFLATPNGIHRVSSTGGVQAWGQLPGGVSSLAWVEGLGLAAAGPQGVGLFSAPRKVKALSDAKGARVRGRGGKLYVMLPAQGGIMQITGSGAQ